MSILKPRSVTHNSIISLAGILASRFLAFVRDILVGYLYGASPITDAFNITMKIVFYLPNLLASAENAAFMGRYIHKRERAGEDSAHLFASAALISIALLGTLLSLLIFVSAGAITYLFPGIPDSTRSLTQSFLRIASPAFGFILIAGLMWSIYQAHHIFTIPYLATLIQNLVLVSVIYAYHSPSALPLGIVLATGVMLILSLVPLGKVIRLSVPRVTPELLSELRSFFVAMVPTTISSGIAYFSILADQIMAGMIAVGAITRLEYANKLVSLPTSIFGISVAGAFFPRFSEMASRNDPKLEETLLKSLKAIWLTTIPSAVGLAILSTAIVKMLFVLPGGKFSATDAVLTGGALMMYSLGIPFQSGSLAISRMHYAFKDTFYPMKCSAISLVTNIALNYILGIKAGMGIMGLALGTSIAAALNFYLLTTGLKTKIGYSPLPKLLKAMLKILWLSTPMGLGVWLYSLITPESRLNTLMGVLLGILIYAVSAILFAKDEVRSILLRQTGGKL